MYNNTLKNYATFILIYFGIAYTPIEGHVGFGIPKIIISAISIFILLVYEFKISKAFIIGFLYLTYQFISASFHPESFRWSTLLFSTILVLNYICIYNIVVVDRMFSIEHFIKICKWAMLLFFVVCIMQQAAIIVGIRSLSIINFTYYLNRGLGCNSLSLEPSHFARIMLVFYYAYIKCCEYKRDEGPFSLKELFNGEHKWVTIRFLWMMFTMGSGTAFICLILLSLYFIRKNNWYYTVPLLFIIYITLEAVGIKELDRATSTIEATSTMDLQTIKNNDSSASARIAPLLNSLNADFTKYETWVGHGIDYGARNQTFLKQTGTYFDDYGAIFFLICQLLNFSCAYSFWSLGTIFLFAGVGGGCGGNIFYGWALMMIMTCVKYFHDNRYNPDIYEEEEICEEETEPSTTEPNDIIVAQND